MNTTLLILAIAAMLATAAALILGLINTVRNDKKKNKRANNLMRWRVGLQALAIALIAALIALGS